MYRYSVEAVELPLAQVYALNGQVPLVNFNRKLYISIQAALCKHHPTAESASLVSCAAGKKKRLPRHPRQSQAKKPAASWLQNSLAAAKKHTPTASIDSHRRRSGQSLV